MPSQFRNISTDTTLGGSSSSDTVVSSQKAIKTYADTKLDKASSSNIVYGTDSSGNQQLHSIVYNAATAWSLPRRNGNGQILVGAPTADTHAATKKYVDDGLGGKVDANTAITASTTKKLVTYDTKGLVTGGSDLTSSDITGALGYTPYNSTNPSGYITSSDVGNGTITITQGGTTKGSFTTNQSGNTTVALDAGGGSYTAGTGISITNNVISNTGLINNATGGYALGIGLGTVVSSGGRSIAIGSGTMSTGKTSATADGAVAIGATPGDDTTASATNAIQLGAGTNNNANTFQVRRYQLLDSSGKIPNARLTISTTMSSSSTDSEIPSTKLLYDTVGNIEALLAAI